MTVDIDDLLRRTDPLSDRTSTITTGELLRQAETLIIAPSAHQRRGRRRMAVATAIGLALTPGVAWAAHGYLAETGSYGSPDQTEGDTSQFIDVCADDFPAYFATLPQPRLAPPTGLSWNDIRDFVAHRVVAGAADDCRVAGNVEQVTGLRADYFQAAESVYECRAYRAHRTGDRTVVASDLHGAADAMDGQAALGVYGDGSWRQRRDAAEAGDYDALANYVSANVVGSLTAEGRCE